jgi:hypothetical protein
MLAGGDVKYISSSPMFVAALLTRILHREGEPKLPAKHPTGEEERI